MELQSASHDEALDFKGRLADKKSTGGWKGCCYVLANEIFDRIAFFAILANLVTYMTSVLHENTAEAATNINNWVGTIYMVTLLGAFLADAFWGRYRTILTMAAVYILGLILLTVSSSLKSLRPLPCQPASRNETCNPASKQQRAFFFVALYLVAVGSGCMKPCVSSFGADQFDEKDSSEIKKKASFFNWWFWGIHAGQLVAVTVLVYIQDNVGWSWGFGIPTVLMVISVLTLLYGTPNYRYQKPHGSPLTTIVKVIASAISKWHMAIPTDKATKPISFLDRAAFARESGRKPGDAKKPWDLCSQAQVEETKVFVRILPMWFGTLLFSTAVAQNPTLFVKQGSTLENSIHGKFKIPPASMLLFTNLTVLFSMPLYDRLFVPSVRKITGHPRGITMLQRMGIGMFITVASMLAGGLVETKRLKVARVFPHSKPLPMTIFWLLPQYILLGLAEVFTYSGQIEFFYDQAPAAMRSLGAALQLTTLAGGSFLSSILITVVNRVTGPSHPWIQHNLNQGHLNFFYWLLAALNVANIGVFVPLAIWFKYKDNEVLLPPSSRV
ncbi:hypothetical protein SELMODRAFT_105638 [Selaginella moellendorffii]|uniref:Uncharacterized protein n=1 Tax=Selaginella moellendorffii TaxID=88036 RepID=D8RZK3_SELML|nr:protein NRT1/ PTR FAMILY 8.1 [Selaginella moellendorffii]EFJ22168.1 hypothetical protein SELMODRAFT_105638 [Selaginella moellendorffii]|eukprot:XP_002976499.1 protein NRT1/ PTR FAMILY 8.1 [Selaginella moellendorffii]